MKRGVFAVVGGWADGWVLDVVISVYLFALCVIFCSTTYIHTTRALNFFFFVFFGS